MADRTSGTGDDRRFTRTPADAGVPAGEPGQSDEWAAGDAAPGHRTPREALPQERLPGEPAPAEHAGGRLPGSAGPGREGPAADDRAPHDSAQPAPGPDTGGFAPSPSQDAAAPAAGPFDPGQGHGTEGLRPGTEDLGSETSGTRTGGTPGAPGASGGAHEARNGAGVDTPLLPHDEADGWERRMREVVAGFVDEPKAAVEEADRALEEIAARFTEAVTERRRALRTSWEGGEDPGAGTDTERLRLALRDYRELAGRLLHG
ncbi:hypothetical protein [Streptomyces dangxiongensis]|uniref:hypothetical protein n=1 Tax=Streptomyces dangxiongensis TaxID=1442032 RepID=UPI001F094770|nr:hypothetical protein [Streptomyces dangxiongensis]